MENGTTKYSITTGRFWYSTPATASTAGKPWTCWRPKTNLSLRSPRAIPPAAGLTRSVPPPALSPTWSSSAITNSAPKCSGPIMGSASPLCWESPATYSARLNMPNCHSPLSPGPRSLPGTKGASSPSRPVNSALS